ncbi:hypothetical protein Tco_1183432 [Tanacetum coccineum]
MSPPIRRKYRDLVAFATGCRRIKNCKRCNRKIQIPIGMWPCRVEEKMTLKEVDGKTVKEIETKIIAKDGIITRVLGEFQGYETSEEEPFAPHRLPQPEGNMNGWLMEDEKELERNEVDSDLESTARVNLYGRRQLKLILTARLITARIVLSAMRKWLHSVEEEMVAVEMEMVGTMDVLLRHSNLVIPRNMMERDERSNEMEKLENEFWNHKMVGANHTAYTNRFHELAKLVPHLVTPESSRIKRAGILIDEAVSCGTLTKGNDKRKVVEESSKSGGSWKDNKKEKVGTRFMATTPNRNEFASSNPKCSRLPLRSSSYLLEDKNDHTGAPEMTQPTSECTIIIWPTAAQSNKHTQPCTWEANTQIAQSELAQTTSDNIDPQF